MADGTDDAPNAEILAVEQEIQAALGDRPFDFVSLQAIANIFRAAVAVRR